MAVNHSQQRCWSCSDTSGSLHLGVHLSCSAWDHCGKFPPVAAEDEDPLRGLKEMEATIYATAFAEEMRVLKKNVMCSEAQQCSLKVSRVETAPKMPKVFSKSHFLTFFFHSEKSIQPKET